MLLFITFLCVGVVSAILFCLYYFSYDLAGIGPLEYDDEERRYKEQIKNKFFYWVYKKFPGWVGVVILIITIMCIIFILVSSIVMITSNTKINYDETLIKYEEQVSQFDNTYDILVNEYENGNKNILIQVQAYNTDVSEFLTYYRQVMRSENSKWLNWYICDAIKNVDISRVRYITVEDLQQ